MKPPFRGWLDLHQEAFLWNVNSFLLQEQIPVVVLCEIVSLGVGTGTLGLSSLDAIHLKCVSELDLAFISCVSVSTMTLMKRPR